jgi:hypothetical protein
MAGMYPDEQTLSIFGKQVSWPGLGANGKFTNGSFTDPLVKPSFIPAEALNLILDNLTEAIADAGLIPNNTDTDQLKKIFVKIKDNITEITGGITADAILAKLLTVGGAGSGLDADMLDGEHGSALHDATKLTGTISAARMPAFTGEAASSAGAAALSLLASAVWLKAHPVNSTYEQYPAAAANDYATAFPVSQRPSYWGGTWTQVWEDSNKVFWRSGGTLTAETDRANGLQGDAIRNIIGNTGKIRCTALVESGPASGALTISDAGIDGASNASPVNAMKIGFDASKVVPTAAENRPINRRMIIWKRTA